MITRGTLNSLSYSDSIKLKKTLQKSSGIIVPVTRFGALKRYRPNDSIYNLKPIKYNLHIPPITRIKNPIQSNGERVIFLTFKIELFLLSYPVWLNKFDTVQIYRMYTKAQSIRTTSEKWNVCEPSGNLYCLF